MKFKNIHILSARQFEREDIERVLAAAKKFESIARKKKTSNLLRGKVLATLFFEPSTRTRLSFETAMLRLGGGVISVVSQDVTSLKKGESLYDTGRMVENYADVIAMRHPEKGSVAELARGCQVPVINAGDGAGEHPTQALLDLFTMKTERGKIDELKIALVGDLKYGRTVHSLSYLLGFYRVKLFLVAPPELKMPKEVIDDLKKRGVELEELGGVEEAMKKVDVLYDTRVQKERFSDQAEYERLKHIYIIKREMVERSNPEITIMHPLPRVGEIDPDVDVLEKNAAFFRQARNGVAVRMALLALVLGKV